DHEYVAHHEHADSASRARTPGDGACRRVATHLARRLSLSHRTTRTLRGAPGPRYATVSGTRSRRRSMHVGVSLFFQNYFDWDRYDAKEFDRPADTADSAIYDEELRLGDLIEPLGFDSIWTVEHHHTPYTMIPDPTQLLSYYAGRTSRVDMGTMVMVLPW